MMGGKRSEISPSRDGNSSVDQNAQQLNRFLKSKYEPKQKHQFLAFQNETNVPASFWHETRLIDRIEQILFSLQKPITS
jgi:hypothetical protein